MCVCVVWCLCRIGNRIVTSLVYLSDVAGGGQTTFSNLDLTVEPQQGRVLVFHNCTADSPSKVDSRTLHAVRVVVSPGKAVRAADHFNSDMECFNAPL